LFTGDLIIATLAFTVPLTEITMFSL